MDGVNGNLLTTSPTTVIESALRTMQACAIKKLPDQENHRVVGILTMTEAQFYPDLVHEVRDTVEWKDEWTA